MNYNLLQVSVSSQLTTKTLKYGHGRYIYSPADLAKGKITFPKTHTYLQQNKIKVFLLRLPTYGYFICKAHSFGLINMMNNPLLKFSSQINKHISSGVWYLIWQLGRHIK